jgi:hypothetical protein
MSKITEDQIEYMRKDLESGMAYTKMAVAMEKFLREKMAAEGKDFDAEFEAWKKEQGRN